MQRNWGSNPTSFLTRDGPVRVAGTRSGKRRNESHYRELFENPIIGIRISSVAHGGRIVEANPAYRRMLGYSAEELGEHTIFDLTHPEDLETNRQLYDEMRVGRRSSYQIEKRFVRKDGSAFWGRLTAYPLRDASGQTTHDIGLVEDVSEHRQAQKALQESTERLLAVLNAALDGIVLIDPAGTIRLVNPSVQRMFGYAAEELVGQTSRCSCLRPGRRSTTAIWAITGRPARRGSSASAGRSKAGAATARLSPWTSR